MIPVEIPGYPGYSMTFRGSQVFKGKELIRPDVYGFYTLEDPNQPEVAAMLTASELHTLTFGRELSGVFDGYTITEAGTVYDQDGQVVAQYQAAVSGARTLTSGHADPTEAAVTLTYWDYSAEVERSETVSIAYLLLGAFGPEVAARYRNPRKPQPGPVAR